MTKQTQEQVAKTLADSGLFGSTSPVYKCRTCGKSSTKIGYCNDGHITDRIRRVKEEEFSIPTADQSEAILAKMGLQVVFYEQPQFEIDKGINFYRLAHFAWDSQDAAYGNINWSHVEKATFNIDRGQRTLANNSALAWCCDNMRAELELAIKEVGSGH